MIIKPPKLSVADRLETEVCLYIYCPTKHAICPLKFNLEFLSKPRLTSFPVHTKPSTNVHVLKKLSDFLFLFYICISFTFIYLYNNQHINWIKRGGGRTFSTGIMWRLGSLDTMGYVFPYLRWWRHLPHQAVSQRFTNEPGMSGRWRSV